MEKAIDFVVRNWQLVVAAVAALFLALWLVFSPEPKPPVNEYHELEPAKEVEGSPKVPVTPAKVMVYPASVKEDLNLPPSIQKDETKVVLESVTVPSDTRDQNVTVVLDTDTGDTTMITKRKELPLIQVVRSGEVRIDFGIRNGLQIARLSVQQDLVQIKAVQVGISGNVDTDLQYFYGVGISYRW